MGTMRCDWPRLPPRTMLLLCMAWACTIIGRPVARPLPVGIQARERERQTDDRYVSHMSELWNRLQIAECRLQIAACGLRTADQRTADLSAHAAPPPRAVLDRDGVRSIGGCENKKEKGSASRYEGPDARVAATISSMYITIPPGFVPRSVARSLRSLL